MPKTILKGGLAICMIVTSAQASQFIGVCWNGTVYQMNTDGSTMKSLGSSGFTSLNSLTRTPSGSYYTVGLYTPDPCPTYVDGLIEINPITGKGTARGKLTGFPNGAAISAMSASATGKLFAINIHLDSSNTLYSIDPQTRVGTRIGAVGGRVQSLAFSANQTLYGYDLDRGLITINTTTGFATDVNPQAGGFTNIQSLAFGTDGLLYGAGRHINNGSTYLYRIDVKTGLLSEVYSNAIGADIRGIAFDTYAPDPPTMALVTMLIAKCAGRRRRLMSNGFNESA